jgi:hypothetical protein
MGTAGQRLGQSRRRRNSLGPPDREVHDITCIRSAHCQRTAGRVEHHAAASRLQPLYDHSSTRQRGVAAKRNLRGGREQAQAIVAAFGYQKSRLRQVVLGGNRLQLRVSQKAFHRHHSGGVSRDRRVVKASIWNIGIRTGGCSNHFNTILSRFSSRWFIVVLPFVFLGSLCFCGEMIWCSSSPPLPPPSPGSPPPAFPPRA